MTVDPGRLAVVVREFAGGPLPQVRADSDGVRTAARRLVGESEREAAAAERHAIRASNRADDQVQQVTGLADAVASADSEAGESVSRATVADRYARHTSGVVASERSRCEAELARAQARLHSVPPQQKAQAAAQVQRFQQAVALCREAAGMAANAEHHGRLAMDAAARQRSAVASATSASDEARQAAEEASTRGDRARQAAMHAQDATGMVRQAEMRGAEASSHIADASRQAEDVADKAADRLVEIDRRGL